MRTINVIVAGHQLSDPGVWVKYLTQRFNLPRSVEALCQPDICLCVELKAEHYRMLTKAPHHALLKEEESYRVLFAQPADVILYMQSVFAEMRHLIQRDFDIITRLLATRATCPPMFTLLNDMYCGKGGTRLSDEELNQYRIPDSRVFRTTIGDLPATGDCVIGADKVFAAILNLFNLK